MFPLLMLGLLVGCLIGAFGIGGVLLVPALHYLLAIELPTAIASCMPAYAFSGIGAAIAYTRRGTLPWRFLPGLALGALPGAYLGALAVPSMPGAVLKLLIAVFMIVTGWHALRRDPVNPTRWALPALPWMIVIGMAVGFGSALSGTGGPLLLIPLLLWLQTPALLAVGLGQVIQIPIAVTATLANLQHNPPQPRLVFILAMTLVIGTLVGAKLAHRLPGAQLRRCLSVILVVLGIALFIREV